MSEPINTDPFSQQLADPVFRLDLRRGRSHRTPATADACVLLVTRAADAEAGIIAALLRSVAVPVLRIDAETAGTSGLTVDLTSPAGPALRCDGRLVTPTVTWIRHFSARAIGGRAPALRRIFAGDSWQALAEQLAVASPVTIGPSGPGLLAQLAAARSADIAIPRTVVTTDLAAATATLTADRLVVKALHSHFVEASAGVLTGVFPQVIPRAALASCASPAGQPVVVQEYVEHDKEIRAYYAGGEVITFEVGKSDPAQLWLEPAQVTAALVRAPAAVAAATRALASVFSLHYGAFDFLVTGGQLVFLEVGVAGDWRWLERKTSSGAVSTAVARTLSELHYRSAGREAGTLALTSFLAAGRGAVDKADR